MTIYYCARQHTAEPPESMKYRCLCRVVVPYSSETDQRCQSHRKNLCHVVKRLLNLCILFRLAVIVDASTTGSFPATSSYADNRHNNSPLVSSSATNNSTTCTVILTETELFNGNSWEEASWSDASTGEPAPSPTEFVLYKGTWMSDWKIVTGTSTRDEFGWDYKTMNHQRMRRRTWIRTYEIIVEAEHKNTAITTTRRRKMTLLGPAVFSSSIRRPSGLRWINKTLRDSYNFKGFGMTFYKSLVFRNSFGVALRLPLTYHFTLFEEHPSLPSIGASLAIYHPWVICLFINTSVRIEVIQWAITTLIASIVYIFCWLLWTLMLRGFLVAGSAVLFPVTRRLYQPTFPLRRPDGWQGPDYSRSVEERVGCAWSWRVSQARGYEYRVTYWHYFAYSLATLMKARNLKLIPSWVVRRVAAIGTSVSAPILDEPYMTANSLLSLSGIYFRKQKRDQRQSMLEETVKAALQADQDDGKQGGLEEEEEDESNIPAAPPQMVKVAPKSLSPGSKVHR